MKNWMYNLFMPYKQYSKVFCLKWLGLLTLTKLWLHLFVNYSACSFRKLNSLTFSISISQYSICTCSILLSFALRFWQFCSFIFTLFIFLLPFRKPRFKSIFLNFIYYSQNEALSFSEFLVCIACHEVEKCSFSWQMAQPALKS